MQRPGIAILNNGGQLTWNIARGLTKKGVFSEVYSPNIPREQLANAQGVILSGSPASVYQKDAPHAPNYVFELGVPVLGICYGWQDIAYRFGGKVERKKVDNKTIGEYGKSMLELKALDAIFKNLQGVQQVWMSHGDSVTTLPPGYKTLGSTKDCEMAAAWNPETRVIGVQFHPESDDTRNGLQMLYNFAMMCGTSEHNWTMQDHLNAQLTKIPQFVGSRKVLHLTSGGGDSTAAAVMLKLALPKGQYEFVYMDPGIMRKGETATVKQIVKDAGLELTVLDTSVSLLEQLAGVVDPEKKRNIIGAHFIRELIKHGDVNGYGSDWIAGQGTIWPDHIESQGTEHSAKIKTHHNRVKEVLELMEQGRLIEPNLYLVKHELRDLAKLIAQKYPEHTNLGTVFAERHPFPGPGLAIRTLCSNGIAEDLSAYTKKANGIASVHGLNATVLPVKSVGQQGDERSFAHPVLLQGEWPGWDALDAASIELTNSMRGEVNRAVYAWEPARVDDVVLHEGYVTRTRLDALREADHVVMSQLESTGWMGKLGQCPTISVPICVNGKNSDVVVIRPVHTKDFHTGQFGRLPEELVHGISEKINALGFSGLWYDVTNKPPGTIEWE